MNFETILPQLIIMLFPAVFMAFWFLLVFSMGRLGKWGQLAEKYETTTLFSGQRYMMQSAIIGRMRYRNALTFGANEKGVYLAIFVLFRMGHPPLFIPWSDIQTTETTVTVFKMKVIEFTFARVPTVSLKVSKGLGEKLLSGRLNL